MTDKQKRKTEALAAFAELIDIIDTLRSPGGCPWDRKQTSKTLKPYFIEETYEALDAIDNNDFSHLREELGDVLLQIMLHSQIAFESEEFHIGHVISGLARKMIQRHPHVFADVQVDGEADVLKNWEQIKAEEKKDKGILDGVPRALPGLLRAYRMGQKVGRVGFDWPSIEGVREKVHEELAELHDALEAQDADSIFQEMGDVLFAMAQWARHIGVDPEDSLRQCCNRFGNRFAHVENSVMVNNRSIREYSLDELEQLWKQAKENEQLRKFASEQ
ncbi:MAG: nucleoside triphosphate pyrophosphohydrolase [Deltaproteobacteria bacterium]|nr:nucleoside triphosphate pyrophosphohydrolase [Deltaproteobacteria bacterium]